MTTWDENDTLFVIRPGQGPHWEAISLDWVNLQVSDLWAHVDRKWSESFSYFLGVRDWYIWKPLIGEADPHYLKAQSATAWCVIYLCYARKLVWHQRSCTSKTHQSSESKMSETFYLSLWATLLWLMAWWLSITAPRPPHLLSYICINLHTIWKITNDNILKNYSQYPSAIQMNNFILKGDRKSRMCANIALYWHFVHRRWKKCAAALNIWCMLKTGMASIGSVCIQRPIKLHSHGGKCNTEKLPTLYIHICLYWLTLATCEHPQGFFTSLLPCFSHIIYSTLFIHLPLSKILSSFSCLLTFMSSW